MCSKLVGQKGQKIKGTNNKSSNCINLYTISSFDSGIYHPNNLSTDKQYKTKVICLISYRCHWGTYLIN